MERMRAWTEPDPVQLIRIRRGNHGTERPRVPRPADEMKNYYPTSRFSNFHPRHINKDADDY